MDLKNGISIQLLEGRDGGIPQEEEESVLPLPHFYFHSFSPVSPLDVLLSETSCQYYVREDVIR
jgi:hypothetical protein